ncbi:hypothetical protein HMPREF0972_00287 [Actinomyces sp. oral taxon 848 str. F0332]|nr:hypothetical protein HMPREF0972_00287 [Actinomyces sp. oral taxon 848 str. F0332]
MFSFALGTAEDLVIQDNTAFRHTSHPQLRLAETGGFISTKGGRRKSGQPQAGGRFQTDMSLAATSQPEPLLQRRRAQSKSPATAGLPPISGRD